MTDGWAGAETAGELIARARERLGKSQYALAEALREACGRGDGIPDRTMVARWETGRRIPTRYWRTHLAAVLQLPPSVLDQAAAVSKAQRAGGQQAEAPRPADRLRFALAHPGSVDLLSVAYLREQVRRLDERYVRVPSTYLFLHDAKTAVAILEQTARELQDQSKAQAVVLGNLAIAHIRPGQPRRSRHQAAPGDRRHRAEPGRGRPERHLRRGPRTAPVATKRGSAGRVRPDHGTDGRLK